MKEAGIALPDPGATFALGRALGEAARGGCTLLVAGPVGAGKSTLAQGALSVWADAPDAQSPTFALIHAYPGEVFHVDLYRLSEGEAEDLGLEDLFTESARVVVEWGERAPHLMPAERIDVRLERQGSGRRARLLARGAAHEALLRAALARLEGSGLPGRRVR